MSVKDMDRKTRDALIKKDAHLRALLDSLPDLVWFKDPDGVFMACNRRLEQLFGVPEINLIGKTDYDFVSKDIADSFRNDDITAMSSGKPVTIEEFVTFADGHQELLETIKTPIYESGEKLIGVLGISRDITQRKKNEEARHYQERMLREVGTIAKIGGWEFNPETGEGTWTEEVSRIHDLDPDDPTSMEIGLTFYTENSRPAIEKAIKDAIRLGISYDLELELISAKGINKWVRAIGQPKIRDGKVVQLFGSFQDITENKLAEQHIENLNNILKSIRDINKLIVHEHDPVRLIQEGCRLLVKNSGYASALIVLTDESGKPVSWATAGLLESNRELDHIFIQGGLPPCINRIRQEKRPMLITDQSGLADICPAATPGCINNNSMGVGLSYEETTYGYLIVAAENNITEEDEEWSLFNEIAGDLAYALNTIKSQEKRKSLEAQLIQAQKMESVGRLAGGVAHDYNNVLSIIIGYTELALSDAGPESPLHADLNEILIAAKRSADITRQLLAFARKQTIAPKIVDLNDVVESILKMLGRLIGEDIDLAWVPGDNISPLKIDPSQVDQVLANLCVNARDAIEGTGKITIETRNMSFDEAYCIDHPEFNPGDYVMLAVSDNGSGIPQDIRGNIFEPFFTTKGMGKGTGLGLATVYGIVKQNNGFINVYSEPDKGTTFRIYLSRYFGVTDFKKSEFRRALPESRGETILLVEDDKSILILGEKMLQKLRYKILTADSPKEAIKLSSEYPGNIHLLITDVVMPEMNGQEMSDMIKKFRPGLKTLYMSGYTSNVIAHHGILKEGIKYLPKPFSSNDLAFKVRETIDD